MKLWAMVLVFHQKPIAMSGIDGNTINANPCASDSAINRASQGVCCRTRRAIGARPPAVRIFPILPGVYRRAGGLLVRNTAPVQTLVSCTNARGSSEEPADLGFAVRHPAASPVAATARSRSDLSLWSAPSRRDRRPDFPASPPSFATPLSLRNGFQRRRSERYQRWFSNQSIRCDRQSVFRN